MMKYRVILLLSVLSFCFLSSLAQLQPNSTNDFPIGSTQTSQLQQNVLQVTFYLVSGNQSTLNMVNKYDTINSPSNPGPFCYLEVAPRPEYNASDYWTKPCPRTPQDGLSNLGFWCRFNFSSDGNLMLTSGANETSYENGKVMWSSNTAGMGVQSIGLFQSSDPAGKGNTLVLFNANKEIVWGNIANNPTSEEYRCMDAAAQSPVGAPTPSAARKLLQH